MSLKFELFHFPEHQPQDQSEIHTNIAEKKRFGFSFTNIQMPVGIISTYNQSVHIDRFCIAVQQPGKHFESSHLQRCQIDVQHFCIHSESLFSEWQS